MPVFFFIDPKLEDDWRMDELENVMLSYTFFPLEEERDDDDDTDYFPDDDDTDYFPEDKKEEQ